MNIFNLSRWANVPSIIAIGKWLPILIAPFAVLFTYGKVQAMGRAEAEQRVEQLTSDVRILSRSLAQAEKYNAERKLDLDKYAAATRVLSNENSEVLDMPAPIDVIDILRPYN